MTASVQTDRELSSEWLHLVRRTKTNGKRAERATKQPTETTMEESVTSLTAQSDRLARNLHMFRLQNKKIVEDNRCIFSDVLKSKRENTSKMRDVFAAAFTMLHSLEGGQDTAEEAQRDGEGAQEQRGGRRGSLSSPGRVQKGNNGSGNGFRRRVDGEGGDRRKMT